jgi:hypothetical protein
MSIKFNPAAKKYYRKVVNIQKGQDAMDAVLERACKYYSSLKSTTISMKSAPQSQIEALYAYVENLNELEKDLSDDFGEDAKDSIGMVQGEKHRAIDQIKNLRIEEIKLE